MQKHSNNNSIILFKTNSGEILKLNIYREKEFAGAFVKVKNGITVMTGNSSGLIKAKIKGLPIKELKDKYFLLENLCETG